MSTINEKKKKEIHIKTNKNQIWIIQRSHNIFKNFIGFGIF